MGTFRRRIRIRIRVLASADVPRRQRSNPHKLYAGDGIRRQGLSNAEGEGTALAEAA